MNIPPPLIDKYNSHLVLLREAERRLVQTFATYAQESKNPFVHRLKSMESTAEKIESGRYPSFSELDDLLAFTIIVPGLAHEAAAIDFCEHTFTVIKKKTRSTTNKNPELFRFDSTRLYARLSQPSGLDAGPGPTIYDVLFEIQIRTAFEHAWIVATHDIVYKAQNVDWRSLRLAAQIKANVEQLDLLVSQFESIAPSVAKSPWAPTEQRAALCALVRKLLSEGIIPLEAKPQDLSRFADNILSLIASSKKKIEFDKAMSIFEAGLRALSIGGFPMSASLFQICLGVLFEGGQLHGPFQRQYTGHITSELSVLFKSVGALGPAFRY